VRSVMNAQASARSGTCRATHDGIRAITTPASRGLVILTNIDESVLVCSHCVFGLRFCLLGFRSGRRSAVSTALREVPRFSHGSNARCLGSACHE
jgi:hypothetical protein